jgi:pyruvate-ferredoxin/flavodoxin oxidoreductase
MPAATGVFRDMTRHPLRAPGVDAENCTACGNCYTECPDTAIPGLVSERGRRLQHGGDARRARRPADAHLRRAVRTLEKKLRGLVNATA